MGINKHDEEIFDWKMRRTLMDPPPLERKCDHCDENSIYVDDFDTSYRHANMEPLIVPMCIECYIHMIVIPMDDQWADYYSGCL